MLHYSATEIIAELERMREYPQLAQNARAHPPCFATAQSAIA
jgi:hypothetical protein